MKNYLFIVRAFNDVDHFSPIIDKILELKKANVFLYSSTPIEFHKNDNNINYLKQTHNLNLEYIFNNSYKKKIFQEKAYIFLSDFFKNKQLPNLFNTFLNKIFRYLQQSIVQYYDENDYWVYNIFEKANPSIVFYDWTSPNKFPYSKISQRANEKSIPIVSLPHGLGPFVNNDIFSEEYKIRKEKNTKRIFKNTINNIFFDWYIVQNKFLKQRLEYEGLDSVKSFDNIVIMGAPRYEKEWINKKNLFQTKFNYKKNDKDIKIVLFPNKIQYKGDVNQIKKIVKKCSDLSDNLVIKPHTRGMKIDFLSDLIKKNDIKIIYDSYNTSQLMEWSELNIMWGTSIGLHALSMGKPIIVPIFAQYNQKTLYENYSNIIIAKDINELTHKILNFDDYKKEFKGDKGVKNILKSSVNLDNKSSVLEYLNFFDKILIK